MAKNKESLVRDKLHLCAKKIYVYTLTLRERIEHHRK